MLKLLTIGGAAVAALAAPALHEPSPLLVWNASASVPRGLYYVVPNVQPRVGMLALVRPPAALARFLALRGYVPVRVPLLKRIAAEPGQIVCRRGRKIVVGNRVRATAFRRDRRARALPVWSGCRRLRADAVFLLNADAPYSLDSRYFGPLPSSSIVGRAVPLLTEAAR
jgi:conjugative transfer signal peptidase TraF